MKNLFHFKWLITCVWLLVLASCQHELVVQRAFYYWKSSSRGFLKSEKELIKATQPKAIYVKFFEVEPDKVFGSVPSSKIRLNIEPCDPKGWGYDSAYCNALNQVNFIPTVFIHNGVFENISSDEIDSLAFNLVYLIQKKYDFRFAHKDSVLDEIQIDCDWTENTKEAYFRLLEQLQKLSEAEISITLRLYPYKYKERMGVPPVKKATLMCYNYFNPLQRLKENSVQNNSELARYLEGSDSYPLQLDVALPIFSYTFWYHNKQFSGILRDNSVPLDSFCSPTENATIFLVEKDQLLDNQFLRAGDVLKVEQVSFEKTLKTIDLLKEHIDFDTKVKLCLFHLGANHNDFSHEEIIGIYQRFSE